MPVRGLTVTTERYRTRVEDARRQLYAVLGRALIADGHNRAGLDTLALAIQDVWELDLFRDVAGAYRTAGDTLAALRMGAWIAVDPRTSPVAVDSIGRSGRSMLGVTAWDSALVRARHEMRERMLARSPLRSLRSEARPLADGVARPLEELTGGRPAVIIFWSRGCGPAIEALPGIIATGERLRRAGTPVLFVAEEEPSEELDRYLADRGRTLPVYHDVSGSTRAAFASFGTPVCYVLDGAGRIRFDYAPAAAQLVAQVEAVQSGG